MYYRSEDIETSYTGADKPILDWQQESETGGDDGLEK